MIPSKIRLAYLLPLFAIQCVSAQNIPVGYNTSRLFDFNDPKCILNREKTVGAEVVTRLSAVVAYDYHDISAFGRADTVVITYTYDIHTTAERPYDTKRECWIADAEFVRQGDGRYRIRESRRKREGAYEDEILLPPGRPAADAGIIGYSDNQGLYAMRALELLRQQLSTTGEQRKPVTPDDIIGSWGYDWNQGGGIQQETLAPLFKGTQWYTMDSVDWLDLYYILYTYRKPSPKYWESVEIGTEPGLDADQVWGWQWANLIFHPDGVFNYIEPVWYPEYENDFSRGSTITYVGKWEISDNFIVLYARKTGAQPAPGEHLVEEGEPTDKIVIEYLDDNPVQWAAEEGLRSFTLISRGYERMGHTPR